MILEKFLKMRCQNCIHSNGESISLIKSVHIINTFENDEFYVAVNGDLKRKSVILMWQSFMRTMDNFQSLEFNGKGTVNGIYLCIIDAH